MSTAPSASAGLPTATSYRRVLASPVAAPEASRRIADVAAWWTRSFTGSADRPGDAFSVRFGDTFVDFDVVEHDPGKRTVWRVRDSRLHWLRNELEWNGTTVVWDVSRDGDSTVVTFTHEGLTPDVECYTNCERGWDFYCGVSLQRLLDGGAGLPDGRGRE